MSTSRDHARDARALRKKLRAVSREMRLLAGILRQQGNSTPAPTRQTPAPAAPDASTPAHETAILAAIALGVPAKTARQHASTASTSTSIGKGEGESEETRIFRHILEQYHRKTPPK